MQTEQVKYLPGFTETDFPMLVENLQIAFYTCDVEGRILFYNKAAAVLWGREPVAEKDRWCGSCGIFKTDGVPLSLDQSPIALAIREQRPINAMETLLQRPDGTLVWIPHHPSPIFDKKRKLTGAANILIDITDQRQTYTALVNTEVDTRNFAKRQMDLPEEERSRIAREIHDEFGQQLAGIKMSLSALTNANHSDSDSKEIIKTMINEVDNTMQSLRRFATELRPGILDTLGLIASIEWLAENFDNKTGIKANVQIKVKEPIFESSVSTCFFRICQEALARIGKYAIATEINIRLMQLNGELKLIIAENGASLEEEELNPSLSNDTLSMRERASLSGAKLSITSRAGSGTIITLTARINGE